MAGLSRYERGVVGLTAAFVLLTGGHFLVRRAAPPAYRVEAAREAQIPSGALSEESPRQVERPESMLEDEVIDLNEAGFYDLQRLPGIGEKRARAIVEYREEHGPFHSLEELAQVPGIGAGTVEKLAGYAAVNGTM